MIVCRYFDNPDLSDVIIVIGEHRFYSHKFALAAQSDVFRDMLIVSDRCSTCPDFQKVIVHDVIIITQSRVLT